MMRARLLDAATAAGFSATPAEIESVAAELQTICPGAVPTAVDSWILAAHDVFGVPTDTAGNDLAHAGTFPFFEPRVMIDLFFDALEPSRASLVDDETAIAVFGGGDASHDDPAKQELILLLWEGWQASTARDGTVGRQSRSRRCGDRRGCHPGSWMEMTSCSVHWRYALWWLLGGTSVILFVASAASFAALWKLGALLVAITFVIEEVGQGLGYWKTRFDLHIHHFPVSLGVTYFFAGMLFVHFLPHTRPAQWLYIGSIAVLTALVEQVLIRAGNVQWGPKMRYWICLPLHVLSLGALYVAALALGHPS